MTNLLSLFLLLQFIRTHISFLIMFSIIYIRVSWIEDETFNIVMLINIFEYKYIQF